MLLKVEGDLDSWRNFLMTEAVARFLAFAWWSESENIPLYPPQFLTDSEANDTGGPFYLTGLLSEQQD